MQLALQIFRVVANKDQLEKHGLWNDQWVVHRSKIPNQLRREYASYDDAKDMYALLGVLRLVRFKNWLS